MGHFSPELYSLPKSLAARFILYAIKIRLTCLYCKWISLQNKLHLPLSRTPDGADYELNPLRQLYNWTRVFGELKSFPLPTVVFANTGPKANLSIGSGSWLV